MLLQIQPTDIQRSEQFSEMSYSIGDPKVVMKILRSKLYSNPIKVVTQEYICNARDANREAGSTKSIEISCPNKLSPTFEVRDYGIGITPDRMENVFTKYGASTKRSDNKQTGGFGLGAKSAWAYTDSFSITTITRENGKNIKRFYSSIIDQNDDGSLIKIGDDEVVDEPTGTRIVIPVKEQDFHSFGAYAKQAVYFWKESVYLNGMENTSSKFNYSSVEYSSNLWVLRSTDDKSVPSEFAYHRGSLAVVDGIAYTIKPEVLACDEIENNKFLRDIFSSNFLLLFNTGDLTVSANREELHFDEKTKAVVIDRLKLVASELLNVLFKEMDKADTYRELVAKWVTFNRNYLSLESEAQDKFLAKFKWKGKPIKIVTVITDQVNDDKDGIFKDLCIREHSFYMGRKRSHTSGRLLITDTKTHIYENDENTFAIHRQKLQTLYDLHKGQSFYIITYGTKDTSDPVKSQKYEDRKKFIREFFNLDLFDFGKTSNVVKKPLPSRATGGFGASRISYKRTKKLSLRNESTLDISSFDMNIHSQVGYYIPALNCKMCKLFGKTIYQESSDYDDGILKDIMRLYEGKSDVFLIPEKTIDRAKEHKKGIKLLPFEDKFINDLKSKKDLLRDCLVITTNSDVMSYINQFSYNFNIESKDLNDPKLKGFFERIKELDKLKSSKLYTFVNEFSENVRNWLPTLDKEVSKEIEILLNYKQYLQDEYPIVDTVSPEYNYRHKRAKLKECMSQVLNAIYHMKKTSCIAAAV